MLDRNKKEVKNLEISAGLLFGYCAAAFINMMVFDKSFAEAFSDKNLIFGFAGVGLALVMILRMKKKEHQNE